MDQAAPPRARFLVRQGTIGWMVYDRDRKGPALFEDGFAEKLTKEQAEYVKERLTRQPT